MNLDYMLFNHQVEKKRKKRMEKERRGKENKRGIK